MLVALVGNVVPASVSTTTQVVSGISVLNGVACASATTCEAVGVNSLGQGVVVPITNGTPGVAQVVSGAFELRSVACPSATTYEAVGLNIVVTITRPSRSRRCCR